MFQVRAIGIGHTIDRRSSDRCASGSNIFVAYFLLTDAVNWEKGRHLAAIFLGPASLLTDAINWEKGRHLAAIFLFLAATHTVKNDATINLKIILLN